MKKLLTKKAAVIAAGVALCLGVCDLTIMEKSHLMPVVESVRESVEDLIGQEAEEKVLEEAPSAE
jgi:hypothetical protein